MSSLNPQSNQSAGTCFATAHAVANRWTLAPASARLAVVGPAVGMMQERLVFHAGDIRPRGPESLLLREARDARHLRRWPTSSFVYVRTELQGAERRAVPVLRATRWQRR